MDIKTYCEQAKVTLAKLNNLYPEDNAHMIFGMITEIGELADVFKKNMAYGKSLDLVNVQEEVGDLMWYIANFCNIHGFDLEEILEQNVAKLKVRYPNSFEAEKAINRNLEEERKVLEGTSSISVVNPSGWFTEI